MKTGWGRPYLNRQSSNSSSVSRNPTDVATIIINVILPLISGRCTSLIVPANKAEIIPLVTHTVGHGSKIRQGEAKLQNVRLC